MVKLKIKRFDPAKFDEQFHDDHAELNRLMKKAGLPLRYPIIKKRK